jgi:3-methyladenine DNA glycosylase AlkD
MTNKELFNQIRRYCKANADPKVVQKYSRYFKEGYDAYGLSQPLFDEGIKSLMEENKITLKLVLDTAPLLLKSGKYEETNFAIRLLKGFSSEFTSETFAQLEKWFEYGIANWAHADMISSDIFPLFLIERIALLRSFASWRNAANKYQRRAAAVTLIKYIKTDNNFGPLFKFIEPLMTDSAREVHQGVGWFLRECWKIKRTDTEAFLLKWKNEGARLIFQYATEKMSAKEKQRFRRENGKSTRKDTRTKVKSAQN